MGSPPPQIFEGTVLCCPPKSQSCIVDGRSRGRASAQMNGVIEILQHKGQGTSLPTELAKIGRSKAQSRQHQSPRTRYTVHVANLHNPMPREVPSGEHHTCRLLQPTQRHGQIWVQAYHTAIRWAAEHKIRSKHTLDIRVSTQSKDYVSYKVRHACFVKFLSLLSSVTNLGPLSVSMSHFQTNSTI